MTTKKSESLDSNAQAAHYLLSELRTRIAIQPLPYQYGIESRALESLWELFAIARQAMKDYPGCKEFSALTTNMLNVEIRPVTAKWHRAHKSGVLDSKDGSNEFRSDLAKLQGRLIHFSQKLQQMAYGEVTLDEITPAVLSQSEIDECFAPINFGIEGQQEIDQVEKEDIAQRRAYYNINKLCETNAIGLALSGGGIRSATFCLGVVQVLAQRNLMKDFDYLSTVSGGGFTGGLISSTLGQGKSFKDLANPYGPDTASIRYVRQNAKYLSALNIKQRFSMIVDLIIGLILNWAAFLFLISSFALLCSTSCVPQINWLNCAEVSSIITVASIFIYGLFLNWPKARLLRWVISHGALMTILFLLAHFIRRGFNFFTNNISFYLSLFVCLAIIIVGLPSMLRLLPVFGHPSLRKVILKINLFVAGALTPIFGVLLFYIFLKLASPPVSQKITSEGVLSNLSGFHLLLIFTGVIGFVSLFLNVNLTGLNKLYRDLISRTFVSSHDANIGISLADLNTNNTAPYHLINATVNLPASNSRVLRDRRGDFFMLSKYWSGSVATGYKKTKDWLSNIDLATAMAISGAATSPQMGVHSKPTLSALMTLFNVRLGYWVNNSAEGSKKSPGFLELLREMTGIGMSEKSAWLYLTDGGHIENLGLYELLRRRCKFIVCVDGEADPMSTFEGKLTLVRHAQIDLGIRMEPRLDDIRLNPGSGFSKTHSHLLRVHYPPKISGESAEIGLMLYLKLSLTGDEAELLKRYQKINPSFPHQSTIDQFYDEEQFEAYRQLGVHVAEGVFSPALLTTNTDPKDIEDWFKQLAVNMLEPRRF